MGKGSVAGKVTLILLAALAIGLYIPSSRAQIWQTVKPVTYPFYGWMSRGEMDRITNDLAQYEDMFHRFPGPREFGDWMDNRYEDQTLTRDAWGSRYQLRVAGRRSYFIVSAGPDGQFDTQDDLRVEGTREDDR